MDLLPKAMDQQIQYLIFHPILSASFYAKMLQIIKDEGDFYANL